MNDATTPRDATAAPGRAPALVEGVQTHLLLRCATDAQIEEALKHAYAAARLGPCGLLLLGGDLHVSMPAPAAPWPGSGGDLLSHPWAIADVVAWWRALLDGMIGAAAGTGSAAVPSWDGRVVTSIDGGLRAGRPDLASSADDCMQP